MYVRVLCSQQNQAKRKPLQSGDEGVTKCTAVCTADRKWRYHTRALHRSLVPLRKRAAHPANLNAYGTTLHTRKLTTILEAGVYIFEGRT